MPEQDTLGGVAHDAGELVREEMHVIKDGIAVGLSKARGAGVKLLRKAVKRARAAVRKRSRSAAKRSPVRKARKRSTAVRAARMRRGKRK